MSLDRGWRTVVVAASGPSIDVDQAFIATQAQREGRCKIIVVNGAWTLFHGADVMYAADASFYDLYVGAIRARFTGELWTQNKGKLRKQPWEPEARRFGINVVKSVPGAGLHPDPDTVYQGGNSGHQAICLAVLFGAKRIVLIGFDMDNSRGAHFHGPHPAGMANGDPRTFIKHFDKLAPQLVKAGVECVNASAATALQCFPRVDLATVL